MPSKASAWFLALVLLFLRPLSLPGQGICAPAAPHGLAGPGARPGEATELWTGSVLTAKFRASVCVKRDGSLRGVALLKHRTGAVDVYHIYGTARNGHVDARHGSGHRFTGELEGIYANMQIRLASGMRFKVKCQRTPGIPVTDDCAPADGAPWR
ncbi:MAG: hypothetical protein II595_08315 [Desulfovibrio sp.]|nr:hypothetical protein [Desulfovibrio sp.]